MTRISHDPCAESQSETPNCEVTSAPHSGNSGRSILYLNHRAYPRGAGVHLGRVRTPYQNQRMRVGAFTSWFSLLESGVLATGEGKFWTQVRTLMVLGRVSNLPTVWSNCLAGWWLGGSGSWSSLGFLAMGASFLYVAGMFLNDAFDAPFDSQHRLERPIPSGRISRRAVFAWSLLWFLLGWFCLMSQDKPPVLWTALLTAAIVIYDWLHKAVAFSPLLMAVCRVFLIILSAACGMNGVTGLAIWSALVLGCYIVGLSYLARRESVLSPIDYWPLIPLIAPLVLGWIVNSNEFRKPFVVVALLLLLWCAKCLAPLWKPERPNLGRVVSGLLAGICLVDLIAVADVPRAMGLLFLGFFVLSLGLQKIVPAT